MSIKITIKTLQQKVFQIEAEPADTVADLKQKIHASQSHPVENQKIIYAGKVLVDDKTIESCNIKEKDFLVLMVSKPKPTPAPPAPSSSSAPVASTSASAAPSAPDATEPPQTQEPESSTTSAPAAPPQPPNAPILTPATATPVEAPAPAPAPETAPEAQPERAFGDTGSFITGSQLQSTIQNMIEMGFEREQVMKALRASYNNPDRAVEYLFNGIPAHLEQQAEAGAGPGAAGGPPQQQPPQAQAPQEPAQPAAPTPAANAPQNLFQLAQQQQHRHPAGAAGGLGGLGGLGGHAGGHGGAPPDYGGPQMQQIRQLLAENPEMIQPMIQQIAASNPALATQLAQNPEALMQLLGAAGAGEGAEDDGEGPIPPGAHVINITPEEQAAIQRLEALGFPRQAVIEAYFACDKNEEMAANYLFDATNFDS